MTEEKENNPLTVSATEEIPEIQEAPQETVPKSDAVEVPVNESEKPVDKPVEAIEQPAQAEAPRPEGETPRPESEAPRPEAEGPREDEGQRQDRGRDDRRYDGRHGGRRDRDRPLTNEDKLRMYKKQSEERLLDIKRGKEAKVGKKRKN